MASGFMIKLTVAIMGSIIFLLLKCKLMTLPLLVIIPPHFLSLFLIPLNLTLLKYNLLTAF